MEGPLCWFRLVLLTPAMLVAGLTFGLRADDPLPPPLVDDVESRLRRLEEMNARLLEQGEESRRREERSEARYRELEARYEALMQRVEGEPAGGTRGLAEVGGGEAWGGESGGGAPSQRVDEELLRRRGPGRNLDIYPSEQPHRLLVGRLGDGFGLATPDDEFELNLRVLDQTDAKVFVPNDQRPARSGLYIPRVRVYFEGRLTRPFEYEVSLQRSIEGVWDLLDGNLNIRPSDAFQVRFGRQLVPYSYEWYDHLEQYFIAPERALFPLNFGLSRSAGLMAHGFLFDDRLEYAVGGFDGHLDGLADNNRTRDAVGYLNWRPFLRDESGRFEALRYLNVGMSGFVGQQVAPDDFLPLRTSLQSSENDEEASAASAVFFAFDEDVRALGGREAGAVHLALYRRSFTLESEIQATRFGVTSTGGRPLTMVPVSGGHLTASYFITGEETTGRGPLDPLRPFDPFHGSHGPGAFEVFARYSQLHLGRVVFEEELADPTAWTRDIFMTDIGFNWYLNRYVKFYVDWQHSNFGSPVLLNPNTGKFGRFDDLLWVRCQIYF